MTKLKKSVFSFIAFAMLGISFVSPLTVAAKPISQTSEGVIKHSLATERDDGYTITNYNINMIVNENNTLDITEKIDVYFSESRHGIYRTIPLYNEVKRLDGTSSRNKAQISNVKVSEKFSQSVTGKNIKIKIGDEDETMQGPQSYTIQYTYNLGKDPSNDYDELYYNLVGTEWDTEIDRVNFQITMPKEFDEEKLGFSTGEYGSTNSQNVIYHVNGNTITGYTATYLNPGEGVTVRLELDDGYFTGAGLKINWGSLLFYIFPIIFVIISYLLWKKYGDDDDPVKTIEFEPPKGLNSLDVGFLYGGEATNKDVVSLLIYLANKGYIKITEIEDSNKFLSKNNFKITKVKEYDGNDINEKMFLEGLFTKKPTLSSLFSKEEEKEETVTEVTPIDLYDNFYLTINKILQNENSKENTNKIFEKASLSKKGIIVIMIIAVLLIITLPPLITTANLALLLVSLLFVGLGITLPTYAITKEFVSGRKSKSTIIFMLIWGAGFTLVPFFGIVYPFISLDPVYLIGYILGLICVIVMVIFLNILSKRTPYGLEMLGKLEGFKEFLETAEKEKLEALVHDNPTYFYDILPYAYVLGVSDTWMKKFETISLEAPDWYYGSHAFTVATFSTFMSSAMATASTSMSSSPSSSGGGSSGGGSGGGGGGSW